jgi:hypothetical protein
MKAKGEYQDQVHSDQMVLVIVRGEVRLCEQWPKANKGGLLGWSPFRSNGFQVVRHGG